MSEVADEPIIAFSRQGYTWYHAMLAKLFSPYTRSLKIVEECQNFQSLMAAVEAGRGVTIVYEIMSRTTGERLVLRPLKPAPQPPPTVVAYLSFANNPSGSNLRRFNEIADSCVSSQSPIATSCYQQETNVTCS